MSDVQEIRIRFQPKGSMCAVCLYKGADCNDLPFSEMLPVIDNYKDYTDSYPVNVMIVKCSNFEKLHINRS